MGGGGWVGGGGGQGGCESRIEVFWKIEKKKIGGGGGGWVGPWGGPGWGVRMDVNEEWFFVKIQKKIIFFGGGGGRVRGRGEGSEGCERRIEVFVKIQKKNFGGGGGGRSRGGGVWGGSGGVRVDVNEE